MDTPPIRPLLASDDPEQRRLATAIGADQPHPLTPVEDEGDRVQNAGIAVEFSDIANLKHGF